jgi:hypothetical protein
MNKIGNWLLTAFFLWLAYKFATQGQAQMGDKNTYAVVFALGLAAVFGMSAMGSSGSKS